MFLGLIILGFIIGAAFSVYYKYESNRELLGNILVAMIAVLQGKVLSSLLLIDNIPLSQTVVLILWVLGMLHLKRLLLRPKDIRYLG